MKKFISLFISIVCLTSLFVGCSGDDTKGDDTKGYTQDNTLDFKHSNPIEVTDEILSVCYAIMDELEYDYDKDEYVAVLLDKDQMEYVSTFDEEKTDMLDENDYLIQFEAMKIIVDAETNIILGSIPYV